MSRDAEFVTHPLEVDVTTLKGIPKRISHRQRSNGIRAIDSQSTEQTRVAVQAEGQRFRVMARHVLAWCWREEGFRTIPALLINADTFLSAGAVQQGRWISEIRRNYGLSYREMAMALGKPVSFNAHLVQCQHVVERLDTQVLALIESGDLIWTIGRHLLGLPKTYQRQLAGDAIAYRWSERQMRKAIAGEADVNVADFSNRLSERLGSRVSTLRHGTGWRLRIDWDNVDQLKGVLETLLELSDDTPADPSAGKRAHTLTLDVRHLDAIDALTGKLDQEECADELSEDNSPHFVV